MSLNKIIKLLIISILFIGTFIFNNIFANGSGSNIDGSAKLDLEVNPSLSESNILGENFQLKINLKNKKSSEGEAFNPGFIVNIPDNIEFISSSDLGDPYEIISYTGGQYLFFKTDDVLVQTTSENYTLNLKSNNNIDLFDDTEIKVLAYAENSIYGRGAVPDGAPSSAMPGSINFAGTGSIIEYNANDINFPANLFESANGYTFYFGPYYQFYESGINYIEGFYFESATTSFVPYKISKAGATKFIVGNEYETSIKIEGNSQGSLNDLHIQEIVSNNREFLGFTQTGGVSNININYLTGDDSGYVQLDLSGINVGTGQTLEIKYKTRGLSSQIDSYNLDGSIELNESAQINNGDSWSSDTTMLAEGTWNKGNTSNQITSSIKKSTTYSLVYASFSKIVDKSNPVIGDELNYTLTLNLGKNIDFGALGSGTYIVDTLPDGISYTGNFSSTNSGSGNNFTFSGSKLLNTGETELIFSLGTGHIYSGDTVTIEYRAILDGDIEDGTYENTKTLTNQAKFYGYISYVYSGWWGYGYTYLVGTSLEYNSSASVTAPVPTNKKRLISVELPDGTIYNSDNNSNYNTGTALPVGSTLKFAIEVEFPNVYFTGINIKDAIPLLMGPNDNISNINFQTDENLKDIFGNDLLTNDWNGINNEFNGLVLSGDTASDNHWIETTDANNIEFNLGSGMGGNTFAITFDVDILDKKPSSYNNEGELPQKNVAIASFRNSEGKLFNMNKMEVPFTIGLPALEVSKNSTGTNVSYGNNVDFEVIIDNSKGRNDAYVENLIDIIPENMNFYTGSIVGSGFTVTGANFNQSGTNLEISFNKINSRSNIKKGKSVIIDYTLAPTTGFVIDGNNRKNSISMDYYSSEDADSKEVNNFGPISTDIDFELARPGISRIISGSSETRSTGNDLLIGEKISFETTITLSGGTYIGTSFEENLHSNLEFISGSIVSLGSDLTFSGSSITTGTIFTGTTIDFGDIVNSSTNPQSIVIQTNAIVKNTISKGTNRKAEGEFNYSSKSISKNTPVNILEPNLDISKTVNPSNAQVGDEVSYEINIEHNSSSNSPAYNLNVKDILPTNLKYLSGTLTGNLDFNGTAEDLFSSGLTLDELLINNTQTINFEVEVLSGVIAGTQEKNKVNLEYSTLENNNGNEKKYNKSDNIDLNIDNLEINHFIESTSLTGTNGDNLTIGEEVIYNINIEIPKLNLTGLTLEQELSNGIEFLTGKILNNSVVSNTSNNITLSGNIIEFDFGDIINVGTGSGTGFVLQTTARVLNNENNKEGNTKNSNININYDGDNSKTANQVNFDIVEPNLDISKTVNPSNAQVGDTVKYTINIEHNSSSNSPAYNLNVKDILPTNLKYLSGTLTGNLDFNGTAEDLFSSGLTLDELLINNTQTINFEVEVLSGVIAGTQEKNKVNLEYSTLKNNNGEERQYTGDTFINLDIDDLEINHFIESTSLTGTNKDNFNINCSDLAIGEEITYKINVDIPKLNLTGVKLKQELPNGIEFLTGKILNNLVVSNTSNNITLSGNIIEFDFGDIINVGTGSGTGFVLETKAIVLDDTNNQAGGNKNSTIKLSYNGDDNEKIHSEPDCSNTEKTKFDIVEPNITISKEFSKNYGQGGDEIQTTINITNNGSAPAYDLEWEDNLPNKTTISGDYEFNSGSTVLEVGDSIEYTYNTILENTVTYGELLSGAVNIDYYSYPGVDNNYRREYTTSDYDTINIRTDNGIIKTLENPGNGELGIGEKGKYKIQIPLLKGTTQNLEINDTLPTGLSILQDSLEIQASTGVVYTGGFKNIINENINFEFQDIVNSNTGTNIEYIIIKYDVVVLDSQNNKLGDTKLNSVEVNYELGDTILTGQSDQLITIVEPSINLD
ncbi:DUF11 domain-containing protein, partial [Candidatus Vampirococcus lugosii]|nr:hypothetical protein [Candidatus Vampirococcus lugosii]